MFTSYSKFVLTAVIASSCFMASCQKKGSARGVQPTMIQGAEPEKKNTETGRGSFDDVNADVETEDAPKPADTPKPIETPKPADTPKPTPAPVATPAPTTAPGASPSPTAPLAEEEKTKSEVQPEKKPTAVVLEKENVEACSKTVTDAKAKLETLLAKVKKNNAKGSGVSKVNEVSDATAALAACRAFVITFKETKSCSIKIDEKETALNKETLRAECYANGDRLNVLTEKSNIYVEKRMVFLKKEEMVMSEEAKDMFKEDNRDWKLYLMDGKLGSDSKVLLTEFKKGRVACAITKADKFESSADSEITLRIKNMTDLYTWDEGDQINNGVTMDVVVKISSKSKPEERAILKTADLSCMNLSRKAFRFDLFKKALGAHIRVKAKVTTDK